MDAPPRQGMSGGVDCRAEIFALVVGEELCIAAERRLGCGGTKERRRLEDGGDAALSTIVAGLGML